MIRIRLTSVNSGTSHHSQSVGDMNATKAGSSRKCSGFSLTPLIRADSSRRFETSGAVRSLRSRSSAIIPSRNAVAALNPVNMMCASNRPNNAMASSAPRKSR